MFDTGESNMRPLVKSGGCVPGPLRADGEERGAGHGHVTVTPT
jgi:hypothetical protein